MRHSRGELRKRPESGRFGGGQGVALKAGMPPIQSARHDVAAKVRTAVVTTPSPVGLEPLQGAAVETLKGKLQRDSFDGSVLPKSQIMMADTKPAAAANAPPDVATYLTKARAEYGPEVAANIELAQKQIAKHDYVGAAKTMARVTDKVEESDTGRDDGLATIQKQVEFLATMQTAKVTADFPPTEKQLVEHFSKLKNSPDEARTALATYTKQFHVHPADVSGPLHDKDVSYQPKGTSKDVSPHQWSDVQGRSAPDALHVGKQVNDCEGFAFMSEKLLTAAGFKAVGHVTGLDPKKVGPKDDPASAHEMMLFKHPREAQFTVTSNEKSFVDKSAKAAAAKGFASALQIEVPKKLELFVGKTGYESMTNMVNQNNPLK